MNRTLLTLIGALLACLAVQPASAGYRLAAPKPMEDADTYSPVCGGHASKPTYAYNASGVDIYAVASTSIGMTSSEKGGNRYVGDALTPPAGVEVDWAKFSLDLTNQPAYKAGYVFYTGSTNANERVIVSNYGAFELTWPVVNGKPVRVSYETGLRPSDVQSKLFWTSAPFNGPGVALSKNYGVKVFGATNLFWNASNTNQYGASVYDYGVHHIVENNLLQVYARQNADGTWSGPVGTIVVAYYDSGSFVRYLGCTVVQVTGPDPVYLTANVGEELLPQNEHYDPSLSSYMPVVQSSQNQTDDPRAPYVFVQKRVAGSYHAKENRVYAISETLPGETGAKKAEVFWECADSFDVFWPFEQTCYHVRWPSCPTVVLAKDGDVPGVTIPDAYTPSLLDWQEPSGVARVDGSSLTLSGKGRFTLKLVNSEQTDFWLLPLNAAYNTDDEAFSLATEVRVNVGCEALPTAVAGCSTKQRELVASVDRSLSAFLYAPLSPGNNWNPNLFHAASSSDEENPFASLASAVWFVNVSPKVYDAELWWFRRYAKAGMDEPVTLPVLPQRYKAVWPGRDDVGEVVFSSQRGSAAGSRVRAGRAARFDSPAATGSVRFRYAPGEDRAFSAMFAFLPESETGAAAGVEPTKGDVLGFAFGGTRLSFAVVEPQAGQTPAVCRFSLGGENVDVTCPTNQWTRFAVIATTNALALYADERLVVRREADFREAFAEGYCTLTVGGDGVKSAAQGVSVDEIGAWNGTLPEELIAESATNELTVLRDLASLRLSFDDATETADGFESVDAASRRSFVGKGLAVIEPGAPSWDAGLFAAEGGVLPRAYVQNDDTKTGYRPNVEHAIVLPAGDAYSLFALRTDMNDATTPPYALVEYAAKGRGAMRAYRVSMTNEWHRWPELACEVGERVPLARPYAALPAGASPGTENASATDVPDGTVTYLDHGGAWYARRDGAFDQYVRYVGEPGFVAAAGLDRDLSGLTLPAPALENCFDWGARPRAALVSSGRPSAEPSSAPAGADQTPVSQRDANWLVGQMPSPVRVKSGWPKNPKILSVAQVLSKPEYGLPDVYGMKTCAIVYPFYGHKDDNPAYAGRNTHDQWIKSAVSNDVARNRLVKLIDPTCRKTATIAVKESFPNEYGFTLGPSGNLVNRKGLYYFQGMPANVADRLFVDITSAGSGKAHLCLVGDYVDNAAGTGYLRANSLTSAEYAGITNVFAALKSGASASVAANLDDLIGKTGEIYAMGDVQPSRQSGYVPVREGMVTTNWVAETVAGEPSANAKPVPVITSTKVYMVTNSYDSADHYALVVESDLNPAGSNWVVLVENDGPGAESLPVTFHVLCVTNSLYCGKILPVTDPNNTLSEQVSVLYTAPLGKTADQYEFQWYSMDAPEDGHVPPVPSTPTGTPKSGTDWPKASEPQGTGLACIDAVADANTGKVTMKNLVNRYWTMHYRAKDQNGAVKGWSNWCQPTLVEGWVQRVLNAITPFSQRLADLSANKAELKYTMPEQIGAPWEGDVALNNENLNNVGLVQLYQTILNRAESMSIAQGAATTENDTNAAVNKQLVECVARLADMHMTLGAEAYSDAQNPLIASSDGTEFPGSVFCFANQVPSLLDEELALLRGRSYSVAPALTDSPFYNRLMWNFTKGVTQGEVAYVNNYNISAVDGVLDANAAAAMYPQGHGDAYGYYLSALKGYYRLLRNPSFRWGEASMMEMLVAGHVVNMDYEEEDKFAECAYNLAKIGAEVVSLTARKQWRDNASDIQSGYFDNSGTVRTPTSQASQTSLPQAFGYGEWACRAGYGALCNWAVANALLPPDATNAVTYFNDASISNVTRRTAASLASLAQQVGHVESVVNAVDAGLNPLGLSSDAIPFDISPADFRGLGSGVNAKSHYEQIRERVGVALDNAKTVLDYANVFGARLRAIENEEFDANADAAEMEASYDRQLIAVYGRPFSDDIGPGKTYEQGYTGPDLYHYMYMNLGEYGLTNVASMANALTFYSFNADQANAYLNQTYPGSLLTTDKLNELIKANSYQATNLVNVVSDKTMSFSLTADGLIAMPTGWTGTRACEGSIQAAYRSFLTAYVQARRAAADYEAAQKSWDWQVKTVAQTTLEKNFGAYTNTWLNYQSQVRSQISISSLSLASSVCSVFTDLLAKSYGFSVANKENKIVGVAYSVPWADIAKTIRGHGSSVLYTVMAEVKRGLEMGVQGAQLNNTLKNFDNQLSQLNGSDFANRKSIIESVRSANSAYLSAMKALESAYTTLLSAQQSFRTVAEEGQQILAARQQARQRQVNVATQRRYADMYARVARNAALSKFSTTFDVAQRYVFELAKVYGYETGLDCSGPASSGCEFVNATIATRALGAQGVATGSSVTDGGLWELVNRMDANFAQLKGRLGINNPDVSTKWFSLRYSNFRISPGEDGDEAWREELSRHWTDDILSDPTFRAYCEPPARAGNVKMAEPGFVFTFKTAVNLAENFFGKTLQGGETKYSSSDYAVKIYAAGVDFTGYENAVSLAGGLAGEPNVYLVPFGKDYLRSPLSADRKVVGFTVVDQVLPLPYDVGENELNSADWVATANGNSGGVDSAVRIRRHSTLRMGNVTGSTRLVGRSVWNDQWLLVIPAAEMNANTATARERFLETVKDIRLGIQAYSMSGN